MRLLLTFYRLVLETLEPLPGDRKCFRMINGVLTERTVADIVPILQTNQDGLKKTLEELVKQYKTRQDEMEKWKVCLVELSKTDVNTDDYCRRRTMCKSFSSQANKGALGVSVKNLFRMEVVSVASSTSRRRLRRRRTYGYQTDVQRSSALSTYSIIILRFVDAAHVNFCGMLVLIKVVMKDLLQPSCTEPAVK